MKSYSSNSSKDQSSSAASSTNLDLENSSNNSFTDNSHISTAQRALTNTVKRGSSNSSNAIQRITFMGANVDINGLTLDEAREHLGRLRMIRGRSGAGFVMQPAQYEYDPADEAALQLRIQALEAAALEARRVAVRDRLIAHLAAQATAADWTGQPGWVGSGLAAVDGGETIGGNVATDDVEARWTTFLGGGPYTHRHPRTGAVDATRLVSADGQRSIRYGDHERNSAANQHHFHEETWTHNPGAPGTITCTNVLRRAPVT